MVREFVDDWKRRRPPTKGRRGRPDATQQIEPVGAYEYLSQETGLPEPVIRRVRNRVSSATELRVADALVGSLGNPVMFHDGTLPISPNPRAKTRAQLECCGHSSRPLG